MRQCVLQLLYLISASELYSASALYSASSLYSPRPLSSARPVSSALFNSNDGNGAEERADSSKDRMKTKLLREAKYPFKTPLIGASVVIGGKGLTDALLTVSKVAAGMRGASLDETFFGVPVLGIDAACVLTGASLGLWTWRTMR